MDTPPPLEASLPAPRCIDCGYTLDGLPSPGLCPECGCLFDLENPATWTDRPPLVRWRLWLPGLITSVLGGTVVFAVCVFAMGDWGWAAWFASPVAMGAALGYCLRVGKAAAIIAIAVAAIGFLLGTMMAGLAGPFCALILSVIITLPIVTGFFLGYLVRLRLKRTRFAYRGYLPLLIFFAMPVVWAAIEGPPGPASAETVVTERVLNAPPQRAWDSIMFYEEVTHEPPWLLKIGLAHPLRTEGS